MELEQIFATAGLSPRVYPLFLDELEAADDGTSMKLVIRRPDNGGAVAIRSDDLPLVETAVHTVSAMVSASSLIGLAPGLVASLLVLLYKFYKHNIQLDAEQARLVFELRLNRGVTTEDLAKATGQEPDSLIAQLDVLKQLRKSNGSRADLVQQEADGRWYLADV